MLKISQVHVTYLKNGSRRYLIEMSHSGLNQHKIIKGEYEHVVQQKARIEAQKWTERWEKHEATEADRRARMADLGRKEGRKDEATARTQEAGVILASLEGLLHATLEIDDTVDWSTLEDHDAYPQSRPIEPGTPDGVALKQKPEPPNPDSTIYAAKLGILDKLIRSKGEKKQAEAVAKLAAAEASTPAKKLTEATV